MLSRGTFWGRRVNLECGVVRASKLSIAVSGLRYDYLILLPDLYAYAARHLPVTILASYLSVRIEGDLCALGLTPLVYKVQE